jgi:predicted nucleotidyltransferase
MSLKELRKSKNLTQAKAAEIAGVSLNSYKNHELGRSKADGAIGRVIREKLETYKEFDFTHGIVSEKQIKEKTFNVFSKREIDFVYLFGSYSLMEAKENSDVDFLVSGTVTGLDFFSLGGELERALGKKVDVLRFQDIVRTNPDLLKEIMATGKRIYDKKQR